MSGNKRFILFAGVPSTGAIATVVVEDTEPDSTHIEEEVDSLLDLVDGARVQKCIWAVFDLSGCDISAACARFGKMMVSHPSAIKSGKVSVNA